MILNPDYPQIIWSFEYRGWTLDVDCTDTDGQEVYAVWANNDIGCAIAVPRATTKEEAIRRGKQYVDRRLCNTPYS